MEIIFEVSPVHRESGAITDGQQYYAETVIIWRYIPISLIEGVSALVFDSLGQMCMIYLA